MTDPLDDLIRRAASSVPVPARLESRIRASVARHRFVQCLSAAAAIVVVALVIILLQPRPVVRGTVIALVETAPSVELRGVELTATVHRTEGGLRFQLEGARDE